MELFTRMTEDSRRRNAGLIIGAAAAASAGAAGMLSRKNVLGAFLKADAPVLAAIAMGMAVAIGNLFDRSAGSATAISVLSKHMGSGMGLAGAESLLGWVPVLGNAANAAITFEYMEKLGWDIYNHFEEKYPQEAQPLKKAQRTWHVDIDKNINKNTTKRIPVV
jgi:uncharacterized protein (DUF697 family)